MIIKCPECGHQVSDRAPLCPSCGVEIAGHIVKCGHCGEIHFLSDITCPNCHHSLQGEKKEVAAVQPEQPIVDIEEEEENLLEAKVVDDEPSDYLEPDAQDEEYDNEDGQDEDDEEEEEEVIAKPVVEQEQESKDQKEEHSKTSFGALVVAFLIAAIVCAVMLYMYRDAQNSNEAKQYEIAMNSTEPAILQAYLDTYQSMNQDHATQVRQRLDQLAKQKTNAKENEQAKLQDEADERDWAEAVKTNTEDAYATYRMKHPNGKHISAADEELKKFARSTIVTPEDDSRAIDVVRNMLIAMNNRSAESLTAAMTSTINFNGQADAPVSAAVDWMNQRYNKVTNLNWHLSKEQEKRQVTKAADQTLTITVPALLSQNLEGGGNAKNNFNIRATINAEGHITALTFTKLGPPPVEKKAENSAEKKPAKTDK